MATPFQVEAWTEYAIGLLVLLIRIVYRTRLVGTNWEGDDYFAAIAVLFWTGELLMLEMIGRYGSITGMSDAIALTLSDQQKQSIVIGSKCLLAGWVLYVTLIWCLKACMLFLYMRLTLNLQQQKMVKITAGACVLCYVATVLVIMTKCMPVHRNWQIYPYPGDACALNIPNYIALAITNVTTDMMILYIPIPLLWSVQMPMAKKIICSLWLCTGVFIIIATLLRCILCLQDAKSINLGTIWSIRETFVAILAVNAPVLGPWIAKNASAVRSRTSKNRSKTGGQESANHIVTIGAKSSSHRLDKLTKDGRSANMGWTEIDNDSEERIMKSLHDVSVSAKRSDEEIRSNTGNIHVKTTFEISRMA
ncbi:hypothetical protein HER10_EVM0008204 [Colletotrichum scovillei]|uniref:uncharacterized protein n=1 Tax=Colletotrichum scovillei TaxID=1209932 RepID=UPI0015C2F6E0|nr:uncharacterized protein HER10_EVM0008204 [Colletotrichum scovillei]KAF4785627.1 hypothetical protein HER10_EVM0008204 [Colletotrichum scovillei]